MTREEHISNLETIGCDGWTVTIEAYKSLQFAIKALEQEPKTIQEIQAESEKYQKAFEDGYDHGYAQARFDYEQEPKTGHWIEVIDEIDSLGNKTWHHKCSICGNEDSGWGNYNYCPNCGAKMESES